MAIEASSAGRVAPSATLAGVGVSTAAMIAWGFSGILVALTSQPGLVVALERMWLGVPMIALVLGGGRRRLSAETLWRSLPGGVLLCADIAMFYCAVKLTSVADATVIGALQPALVLLIAPPLFGERFSGVHVAWTAVAVAGVVAVVAGTASAGDHEVPGDLLATGSMCCWTGYWLVSKHARTPSTARRGRQARARPRQDLGSLEYTAAVMLIAAVAMVPVTLLSGEPLTVGSAKDWLWMAILALIPGSAHFGLNWAHRFVSVSVSSVIVSVSPVIAAGAAYAILHQPLDAVQIGGGLLAIVAAGMVAQRAGRLDR